MGEFRCNCGDNFETKAALSSHERYCDESRKKVEKEYECECGETFKNGGHFNTHRNFCEEADREFDKDLSREKVECPDCGSMVADTQLENHRGSKSCQLGGPYKIERKAGIKIKKEWKIDNDEYECPKCGKIYSKKGIATHYWTKHTQDGKDHIENLKERNNRTTVDFSTENFEGECKYCNKEFENPQALGGHQILCFKNPNKELLYQKISNTLKGKELTKEHKMKIQEGMKKAVKENPASYAATNVLTNFKKPKLERENNEIVKFDSGWELEVAEWLDKKNIDWDYDAGRFEYKWKGSQHFYYPDFYLPEQEVYLEVKGYEFDKQQNRCKWRDFPHDIIILREDEINQIREENFSLNSCETWN